MPNDNLNDDRDTVAACEHSVIDSAMSATSCKNIDDAIACFEKATGSLNGNKLRRIAEVARELKSADFGILLYKWIDIRLYKWIDQSLKSFPRTGDRLANEWIVVGSMYQSQRTLFAGPLVHRQEDHGDITECVIASRGQVEARFLALWARYMDCDGTMPRSDRLIPKPYKEMCETFRAAYVDSVADRVVPPSQRHARQALLMLSNVFDFPEYKDFQIRDIAAECQKIRKFLDIEHDDLEVLVEDTASPKDSLAWLRLGSVYIDACNHIAGIPIEVMSRHPNTRNEPRAPKQYLRRALCCFSHGRCEKLSMYRNWFDLKLDTHHQTIANLRDVTDDHMEIEGSLIRGYAEIGRELHTKAKRDGQSAALMQETHIYSELLGPRSTATAPNVQNGAEQARMSGLLVMWCAFMLGLLFYFGERYEAHEAPGVQRGRR